MNGRRWLWAVLAATLLATGWTAFSDDGAVSSAPASARAPGRVAGAAPNPTLARQTVPDPLAASTGAAGGPLMAPGPLKNPPDDPPPARPEVRRAVVDVFAAYGWQPPPPPPAPVVPTKPSAPPLPFVYAGRVIANGQTQYLLLEQGRLHSVAAGAELGDYTFESASDAQLSFLHRPTGERQTLALAPTSAQP